MRVFAATVRAVEAHLIEAQSSERCLAHVRTLIGAEDDDERVLCVENETSFLDLVEQRRHEATTICIYTEGQANRAVIALLRRIAQSFLGASFEHHGDLDLPGVRIVTSLMKRSGLCIQPINMDAVAHERFESTGIDLTDEEHSQVVREDQAGKLPCQELLQRLVRTRLRIEQEVITGSSEPNNDEGSR